MKKLLLCLGLCGLGFWRAEAQKLPFPQYNGEKFAVIDALTFKPLTPYKYESIGAFHDGLSLCTSRSEAGKLQYSFLNAQGKEIISPSNNRMFDFSEGKARYRQGNKFGYLDTQGKTVVPANYFAARDYKEGRALVQDFDSLFAVLDEQGNVLARLGEEVNFARDYADGLMFAGKCRGGDYLETENNYAHVYGDFAFYDKRGKLAIDLKKINERINYASSFKRGVAIVGAIAEVYDAEKPTVFGAINTKGELIVPLMYANIDMESNEQFLRVQKYDPVTYQNTYGLLDFTGKVLMPCTYTFVFPPAGKYRAFQQKMQEQSNDERYPDRYGVADIAGKIIREAEYRDLFLHKDGFCLTMDSVYTQIQDGIYKPDEFFYTYRNISGKALHRTQETLIYNYYQDRKDGALMYFAGINTVMIADKYLLMKQETHELLTPLFDDIAPLTELIEGERIAVREGKQWFFLNEHFERTTPAYEFASNYAGGNQAVVKKAGKFGLIDHMGREVLPFAYDSIVPPLSRIGRIVDTVSNEMMGGAPLYVDVMNAVYLPKGQFIAKKNNLWGIIQWNGQTVLPFQYEAIHDVFYNYVVVGKGKKMGVIDFAGKELVPMQFDRVEIVNDLAYVYDGGKVGLYDLSGNQITKVEYESIAEPQTNLIQVKKGGKIGYLDYQGKEILPPIYDEVGFYEYNHSQKYVPLKNNGKWGVANGDFKVIVPCEYDSLIAEEWKKFIWVQKNGSQGLLDGEGKVAIPIKYQHIDNIERENYTGTPRVLSARLNNKWGLLDTLGKTVLPFEYDFMQIDPTNKQALIGKKGKFGAIKGNGSIIIPLKYDEIGQFYIDMQLVGVKKKGKWGFVNQAGKEVIAPAFDDVRAFSTITDGTNNLLLTIAKKGKYWGVINEAGKTVVPFRFESIEYLPYHTNQPIPAWRNGVSEQINFKGEPYLGE